LEGGQSRSLSELVLSEVEVVEARGSLLENIKIYPNPGKDQITVNSEFENCKFELIDALGSIQKTGNLIKGNNTINTSSLVQGIYFYRVVHNDTVVTGKWIKE
jgi:hypothetical protein